VSPHSDVRHEEFCPAIEVARVHGHRVSNRELLDRQGVFDSLDALRNIGFGEGRVAHG
jgi:hypothetical protein